MNQYACLVTNNSITDIPGSLFGTGPWPGTLVASPRSFKYNNFVYNLSLEGVYKFNVPFQNTTNMIIYDNDIVKLIESLSYLIVPGQDDTVKSVAQLNSKALTSRIHLLCGMSCTWVKAWCVSLGIPCRIINTLRSDTLTGFYDGHVLLEVKINGLWKLFDVNLGFKFVDYNNNLLALKDLYPLNNTELFQDLHAFKNRNPSEVMLNNVYHHSSTIDIFLGSREMLVQWQKGVMQIPGILAEDNLTYFYLPEGTESKASWVLSLSSNYRIVSYQTWLNMFY